MGGGDGQWLLNNRWNTIDELGKAGKYLKSDPPVPVCVPYGVLPCFICQLQLHLSLLTIELTPILPKFWGRGGLVLNVWNQHYKGRPCYCIRLDYSLISSVGNNLDESMGASFAALPGYDVLYIRILFNKVDYQSLVKVLEDLAGFENDQPSCSFIATLWPNVDVRAQDFDGCGLPDLVPV